MPNQVQVDFVGNPQQLFNVADQVKARLNTVASQITNAGGNVNISQKLVEPVKKASTEVERINRQTALNAKKNADTLTTLTRNRVNAEIALERSLERSRDNLFKQSVNNRIAAMKTAAPSGGGGIAAAGGLASGLASSLGVGIGVGAAVGLANAAVERAGEAERANRLLASSAIEAGIAFGTASEKNKKFAESLGLSERQAAATTAKILQLAGRSGQGQNADKLLGGFADLGSAFGIDPKDLQTLIGTILSGQDEGLNRLGIADPGALYKEYAKQIGTTADKLTQMQKVQAATNAVMAKATTFTGAASDRMNSLEGRTAKAAAAYDTFTTKLSENFAQSRTVSNFITTLTGAFTDLAFSIDDVNKKLAEGKTPSQIAKEMAPDNTAEDYATAALTYVGTLGPIGQLFSTVRDATSPAKILEDRRRTLADQIANTQRASEKTALATKDLADGTAKKLEDEKRVSAELEKQAVLLEGIREKVANPKTTLNELRNIRSGVNGQVKDPKEAAKLIKDIDKTIEDSVNRGLDMVKNLATQYQDVFARLRGEVNSENPFVKIWMDSDRALSDHRKNLAGLSPELQATAAKMQQTITARQLFAARLDNRLDASNLRNRAADFRNPGPSDALLEDRQKRFVRDFLYNSPNLSVLGGDFSPESILKRFASEDFRDPAAALAKKRLSEQIGLINRPGLSGDERSIADARLVSLASGVDPRSLTGGDRNTIASAYERQAVETERREIEGLREQKEQSRLLGEVRDAVKELQGVAQQSGSQGVEIEINNRAENATVKQTPKKPTQKDTQELYSGAGSSFNGNLGGYGY